MSLSDVLTDPYEDMSRAVMSFAERPIAFYPSFARLAGSVNAGLFLSQLFYWTPRGKSDDGWIYKTQSEWTSETLLSRKEQETARRALREIGVIEEKLVGLPAALHYRIRMPALVKLLSNKYVPNGQSSVSESDEPDSPKVTDIHYPKNTTETTTESLQAVAPPTEGPKQPKPKPNKPHVTDDERKKIHDAYDHALGASEVDACIDQALLHKAALKYPGGPWYLYARGWVRDEANKALERASRRTAVYANGRDNGARTGNNLVKSVPANDRWAGL